MTRSQPNRIGTATIRSAIPVTVKVALRKPSKQGNEKVVVDGIKFASRLEARRWKDLVLLERAGEISDLLRQVPYELAPAVILDGRKKPALRYLADFVYRDKTGRIVVEDAKGHATDMYRAKRHLMKTVLGIEIVEIRK